MSTHKNVRLILRDGFFNICRIAPGTSGNVCDHHSKSLKFKSLNFRIDLSHIRAVDVAIHGAHCSHFLKFIHKPQIANVSCVPNLIAVCEVVGDALVGIPVRV